MFDDADKFLKIAVGLGVLAAGAGVGYHFGVYIPQIEREKIERMEQAQKEKQERSLKQQERLLKQQEARKERYNACNADAFATYELNWASSCKLFGVNNKGKDCSLPSYNADNQNQRLADDKKRCLDEFKSGI
jgi:hypothetical protein